MSDELPECRSDAENTPEKISGPDSSYGNPDEVCPVCCSPLLPGEETIICPDCKKTYHKACWNDNNGCTTYGCSSIGCLNPAPKIEGSGATGCTTRKMACPHCGISLTAGVTFCWSCGRDLIETVKTEAQKQSSKYKKAVSVLGVAAFAIMLDLVVSLFFHKSWFSCLVPPILQQILRDDLKIFFGTIFFIINISLWLIARKYLWGLIIATVLCSLDVLRCLLFSPLVGSLFFHKSWFSCFDFPVIHILLAIIFSNGIYAQLMMRKKGQ